MSQSAILPASPVTPDQAALRQKIGVLCHLVRVMGIAYAVWILASILRFWVNEEWVIFVFNMRLKTNIGGVSTLQRVEAGAVDILTWLLLVGIIVSVWRLFGGFLKGSIFTVDAAQRLRSVGMFGIAVIVVGLVCQPIKALFVTAHLSTTPAFQDMLILDPASLLNLTFCAMLIALAHVFKSASELASDNAGII